MNYDKANGNNVTIQVHITPKYRGSLHSPKTQTLNMPTRIKTTIQKDTIQSLRHIRGKARVVQL